MDGVMRRMEPVATIIMLIFYLILVVGVIVLFALLVSVIRIQIATREVSAISFYDFFSILWHYVSSKNLNNSDIEKIGVIAQPLIILLSVLALIYPLFVLVRDRVRNFSAVVKIQKSGNSRNRRSSAKRLANEFANADHVCTVSGDYSWFHQDGDSGLEALKSLLECSQKGSGHCEILSYKSREEVVRGMNSPLIAEELRDGFLALLDCRPNLNGLKITITRKSDYRKLHMVAGSSEGDSEQFITIKDKDYGRKLINMLENLCKPPL